MKKMLSILLVSLSLGLAFLTANQQTAAANSDTTIPTAFRGTWYQYAGQKQWNVTKITKHSFQNYMANSKKQRISSNLITATPSTSGDNKLSIAKHKTKSRTAYTFFPDKNNGYFWIQTAKINGKKQKVLVNFTVQPKMSVISTKGQYTKDYSYN